MNVEEPLPLPHWFAVEAERDSLRNAISEARDKMTPIIDATKHQISTHSAECWKSHPICALVIADEILSAATSETT